MKRAALIVALAVSAQAVAQAPELRLRPTEAPVLLEVQVEEWVVEGEGEQQRPIRHRRDTERFAVELIAEPRRADGAVLASITLVRAAGEVRVAGVDVAAPRWFDTDAGDAAPIGMGTTGHALVLRLTPRGEPLAVVSYGDRPVEEAHDGLGLPVFTRIKIESVARSLLGLHLPFPEGSARRWSSCWRPLLGDFDVPLDAVTTEFEGERATVVIDGIHVGRGPDGESLRATVSGKVDVSTRDGLPLGGKVTTILQALPMKRRASLRREFARIPPPASPPCEPSRGRSPAPSGY